MKKILITGASGFLGRHLLKLLLDEGYYINVITRNKKHSFVPSEKLRIFVGDFADPVFLKSALDGCLKVIHLAAKISFNPSDEAELMRVNVEGTRNLLNVSSSIGVEQFIFISSAITVGLSENQNNILDENSFAQEADIKRNIYLKSKIEAEKLVLESSTEAFKTICLNPVTVFGQGDYSLNSGSLIRMSAASAFVVVPPGGTSVVDAEDVSRAVVLAIEKARPGERYILTNENLSFFQLFSDINSVIGRRPILIMVPRFSKAILKQLIVLKNKIMTIFGRPNWLITPQIVEDTFNFKYYSNKKALNELDWKPQVSFKESVSRAWKYYLENKLLK